MNWLKDNFKELPEDPKNRMKEFEWVSYVDIDVISCIPPKVLHNRRMREPKVQLIVYVTVEMHKINRVLRWFGWRQQISLPPQDLKDLHKMDIRGKDNIDWSVRHEQHIEAWDRRMQSIPFHK
ncbi:hypothetical protein J1N35_044340 [Gossypium stocksii]|uniref:Aminotransferase-like plant mobile domain-containing protein n=1 Tax=Gossypium stocksii TaxID=47602 RepID=A0A9D3ZFW8_9ROSI|nr:hypothetical protein J1N35_044340 [Gossypium stocksii]